MIEELYAAFRPELVRWCRTMIDDDHAAEDLVQEAFVRAIRSEQLLESLTQPQRRAWLYSTVKHLCIDALRRRRFESTAETLPETPVKPHAQNNVEWAQLLEALPNREGVLLCMRYVYGYTSGQIGAILGLPPGTVRSRLSAARQHLRRMMEPW